VAEAVDLGLAVELPLAVLVVEDKALAEIT
jgi:hypothetical protein